MAGLSLDRMAPIHPVMSGCGAAMRMPEVAASHN